MNTNTNKEWLAYGKLADGTFAVEGTRFPLFSTKDSAQAHADGMMASYNEKQENQGNPMVRAWAQEITGQDLVPKPKEPTSAA